MADTDRQEQAVARVPLKASDERAMAIIPRDFEGAWRMAQVVVAAKMAPKSYEDSVERVCLAIMHGLEVGLTPMAALQSIAMINNIPTLWGDAMLGLVRQSGLMDKFQEEVQIDEQGEPTLAICRVHRKGDLADVVGSFTRVEAQKAGLWNKTGPWQQYRPRMMKFRARGWALRDAFPDVLRGLHSAEEISDIPRDVTMQGWATTAPPEPRRRDSEVAPATATNQTATADPVPPEGTTAPHAVDKTGASAGGSSRPEGKPAQDNEPPPAGPEQEQQRNWRLPPNIVGQDAVIRGLHDLLSMTRTQGDVDQLCEQNAERIAKITGTKGSQWRFDVQTRRAAIQQGRI
jgi:hypothetical protein